MKLYILIGLFIQHNVQPFIQKHTEETFAFASGTFLGWIKLSSFENAIFKTFIVFITGIIAGAGGHCYKIIVKKISNKKNKNETIS